MVGQANDECETFFLPPFRDLGGESSGVPELEPDEEG